MNAPRRALTVERRARAWRHNRGPSLLTRVMPDTIVQRKEPRAHGEPWTASRVVDRLARARQQIQGAGARPGDCIALPVLARGFSTVEAIQRA